MKRKPSLPKGLIEKDGKYVIRIRENGRLIRRVVGSISIDNRRRAEAMLAEIRNEQAISRMQGQPFTLLDKFNRASRQKTFAEAAEDYMAARRHCKPSTLVTYKDIFKSHLLPEFGGKALSRVTTNDIERFKSTLALKVSPSRANDILQILRSIMADSCRSSEITRDPCAPVKRLQQPKPSIDPLSKDELIAVIAVMADLEPHFRPFYIVQAYTGARPNELQALRWGDIDWNKEEIHIRRGLSRGSGANPPKEGLPKTMSSIRTIPMTPPVKAALLELKSRPVKNVSDYVFTTKRGERIVKHMDRPWTRALKRAGIKHRPSYQLRHTFISQCILDGLSLTYIAKIVGHSTIDTLVRHYARWIDQATPQHDEQLKKAFSDIDISAPASGTPGEVSPKVSAPRKARKLRVAQSLTAVEF